ncbi:MAG: hypothetical protein NT027_11455 [Proteobacteria bacterium]|nr:hypothetical protein [Pseudomonadota bacterium]
MQRKLLFLMTFFFVSSQAFSQNQVNRSAFHTACSELITACEKAGFERMGRKKKSGKSLHLDCIAKIFKGETIPGVDVSTDGIASCKTAHESMMNSKSQEK